MTEGQKNLNGGGDNFLKRFKNALLGRDSTSDPPLPLGSEAQKKIVPEAKPSIPNSALPTDEKFPSLYNNLLNSINVWNGKIDLNEEFKKMVDLDDKLVEWVKEKTIEIMIKGEVILEKMDGFISKIDKKIQQLESFDNKSSDGQLSVPLEREGEELSRRKEMIKEKKRYPLFYLITILELQDLLKSTQEKRKRIFQIEIFRREIDELIDEIDSSILPNSDQPAIYGELKKSDHEIVNAIIKTDLSTILEISQLISSLAVEISSIKKDATLHEWITVFSDTCININNWEEQGVFLPLNNEEYDEMESIVKKRLSELTTEIRKPSRRGYEEDYFKTLAEEDIDNLFS